MLIFLSVFVIAMQTHSWERMDRCCLVGRQEHHVIESAIRNTQYGDIVFEELRPFLEKEHCSISAVVNGCLQALSFFTYDIERNSRVKPTSELIAFAATRQSAFDLVGYWKTHFSPVNGCQRLCNIRVALDDICGSRFIAEALNAHGFRVEAVLPDYFKIGEHSFSVAEYAFNTSERDAVFPERDALLPKIMNDVFLNSDVVAYPNAWLNSMCKKLSGAFELRRAVLNDSAMIVELLSHVFPIYGTCNLAEAIPVMLSNNSSVAPIVYVSADRTSGRVVGTCTVEKYPFATAELTDVAVHPDFNGNGLGTALCYLALCEARCHGVLHYYCDDVPDSPMNKVAKRLGASLCGIHRCHVRISTRNLRDALGRDDAYVDLVVCSGSTEFV
ncbi:GNAT family N-acetyltransferase [Candidatus Woesearchaeota archaeon]|nr:GNAT family N-acetyltransferase [Candidatus Woesearchaeota archaeon]